MPESDKKSEKEPPKKAEEAEPKKERSKKKGKDEGKDEEKEKKEIKVKKVDYGPDFKHIVRLLNTDLDGTRPLHIGLTAIPGIGNRISRIVSNMANLDFKKRIGHFSDAELSSLESLLKELSDKVPDFVMNRQEDPESGRSLHVLGTDLTILNTYDINMMKKMKCYKGVRHESGHKVRGQRTKSNGRKGLALGVIRQKAIADAKAKAEAESGGGAKAEEKKTEEKKAEPKPEEKK
jgi:small subunit ribosomal protein S13